MLTGNIKKLCRLKGISVQQLEAECGFGKSTLYRWDRVQPSLDKVMRVAKYFNVSLDEIAGGDLAIDAETIEYTRKFSSMDEKQRGLVKCYMAMVQDK